MEYVIRNIDPGDPLELKAVARVEAVCFPPAEAAPEAALCQRAAAFPDSFLVARRKDTGEIIGFINGSCTDDETISDEMFEDITLHRPDGAYQAIFGLDVLPEYRHQGVAKALMNALIDRARQQNRAGLILTCKEHLLQFYGSFGYVNGGVSKSVHGGAVWYDMILRF